MAAGVGGISAVTAFRPRRFVLLVLGVATAVGVSAGCAPRGGPALAFIASDGNLVLGDLAGRWQRRVTEEGKVFSLSWSPSGRWLACIVRDDGADRGEIFVYEPASGQRAKVAVRQDWALCSAAWSPDEKYLAVDSGTGCCGRTLEILSLADATAGRWVSVGAANYCLSALWSPGGAHVAMGVEEPVEPPLPVERGNSVSVALLAIPSLQQRVVIRGTRDWLCSPIEWRGEETLVYEMKPAEPGPGRDVRIMGVNPFLEGAQPWPTGLNRGDSGQAELLAGVPDELAGEAGEFSVSADGRFVVFSALEGGARRVYVLDRKTGGKPRVIGEGSSPALRPGS